MANLLANFMQEEANRLAGDIDRKITKFSPYLSQVPKKAWPDRMGHTITNVVWDRSFAATENAWEDIVAADGNNNVCLPAADLVEFTQTTYNTNLATKAVKSPQFCIDDLKVKWKAVEQMGNITRILGDVVKKYESERARQQYQARCNQKVVADASLTTTDFSSLISDGADGGIVGDAQFADATPASIATHGILDYFHSYLDREGAGEHSAAQDGGGYIYKLITSAEHSQWLRKSDAAVRTDFRESSQSDVLLKGLGITHTYNGYAHIIDPVPRRWKRNAALVLNNGWEEVPAYVDDGNGSWIQNPEYRTAPYEDLVIYVSSVMDCMVPVPESSIGAAKFQPQNYRGDFKFLNILHEDDNPLGNIGRFYGRITNGFKTRHPEYGITVRHQRAPLELDLVDVTV